MHAKLPILGYRIGNMAWITDMSSMPESEYEQLNDLDVLVMNALRPKPHPSHQSIDEALENVCRISPKKAYFVHMSHHIGLHAEADKLLPPHVRFAYDGLVIDVAK
jgi:phosphoribosyl 1,2-cyclic phosphate phosphodiesterase